MIAFTRERKRAASSEPNQSGSGPSRRMTATSSCASADGAPGIGRSERTHAVDITRYYAAGTRWESETKASSARAVRSTSCVHDRGHCILLAR